MAVPIDAQGDAVGGHGKVMPHERIRLHDVQPGGGQYPVRPHFDERPHRQHTAVVDEVQQELAAGARDLPFDPVVHQRARGVGLHPARDGDGFSDLGIVRDNQVEVGPVEGQRIADLARLEIDEGRSVNHAGLSARSVVGGRHAIGPAVVESKVRDLAQRELIGRQHFDDRDRAAHRTRRVAHDDDVVAGVVRPQVEHGELRRRCATNRQAVLVPLIGQTRSGRVDAEGGAASGDAVG